MIIFLIVIVNIFRSNDDITISMYNGNKVSGITYNIDNLENGIYKADFFVKEYKHGEFVEEYNLYSSNIEHKSRNVSLKVGVEDSIENHYIKAFVKDSFSKELKLNFLENNSVINFLIIEKAKVISLDEEIPIVVYNNSEENVGISSGYDIGQYEDEVIIYLKLSKVS